MKRREFIILSGIGATSASLLSACGHPEEKLIPALIPDEEFVPGIDYWKASTCGMCPAGCGIIVRTREHKANKIEGNPLHPVNRGALCARGQAGLEVLYNPDRIKGPMKRVGERGEGKWEEIGWEEAIKTLADKLRQIEADNRASKSAFIVDDRRLVTAHVVKRFMDAYGAHSFLMRPLFDESDAAVEPGSGNTLIFDIANATYLLSFGARFLETWLSPVMYSLAYGEFRRSTGKPRGKFVQVEPRMSLTAANADEWLPAQVGAEALVALAIAQVIVRENLSKASLPLEFIGALQDFAPEKTKDRSDVPVERIVRMAREFAASERPIAIGSTQSINKQWVDLLNLLVGNRDKKGGVLTTHFGNDNSIAKLIPNYGLNRLQHRELSKLLEYHRDGAVLICESNPVHISPALREQFNQVSFIASFSMLMDETTQMADLVLPNHSSLESWDIAPLYSPNANVPVGLTQPVINPSLNTMQTADVLFALSREMGGELAAALPFASAEDFVKHAAADLAKRPGSIDNGSAEDFWGAFSERGLWVGEPDSKPPSPVIDEKSHAVEWIRELDPLRSRSTADHTNTLGLTIYEAPSLGDGAFSPSLQELPDPMTSVMWGSWVEINPKTASSLGIKDGDLVEISTEHGSLRVPAILYPAIRPDVIAIPFGQGHTGYGRYATNRGANPAVLNPGLQGPVSATVSKVEGKAELIRFGTALQEQMENKPWR